MASPIVRPRTARRNTDRRSKSIHRRRDSSSHRETLRMSGRKVSGTSLGESMAVAKASRVRENPSSDRSVANVAVINVNA